MKEYLTIKHENNASENCYSKDIASLTVSLLAKAKKDFQLIPCESGRIRTILFAGFCGVAIQALDSLQKRFETKYYGNHFCTACEQYMLTIYNLTNKDNQLIYIEEEIISCFKEIDIADCINAMLYIANNQNFAENWLMQPYLSVANKAKIFLTKALKQKPSEQTGKEIYEIVFANSTIETEEAQ